MPVPDQDSVPSQVVEDADSSILYKTAYAPETSSAARDRRSTLLKFDKFMIQTSFKKILIYLTQDSLRTVKQVNEGL